MNDIRDIKGLKIWKTLHSTGFGCMHSFTGIDCAKQSDFPQKQYSVLANRHMIANLIVFLYKNGLRGEDGSKNSEEEEKKRVFLRIILLITSNTCFLKTFTCKL